MKNRPRIYSVKRFLILLIIVALSSVTMAPSVHALPLTGNFEVTFNQIFPVPVANAGHGTFTANNGLVTNYEFEFTVPFAEDFEGPPSPLAWNGTILSGSDLGEYFLSAFLQFLPTGFGANSYELSVSQTIYFDNLLGSTCQTDGIPTNCLAAIGTYSINQVPEPSSLVLLAIGLALNSIRRRSKESKKNL